MRHRVWIGLAIGLVLMWSVGEAFAGRGGGGRGGGGRGGGGGMRGGGGRPSGGMSRPSGGMSRPSGGMSRPSGGGGRTPSFSQPSRPSGGGNRPSQLPSGGSRPSVGGGAGSRPSVGGGAGRPSQLPATGARPGAGNRPPIASQRPSNRPSTRPDAGNRPSQLPAFGAGVAGGVAGAGLANRVGNRPATLPGLGDRRPSAGQLPAGERRNNLSDRINGGEGIRDGNRNWDQQRQDWQDRRDDVREDWQDHRDDAREDWQDWHDDHYPWYGGWYGGFASGYWGLWDSLWDDYPVAAAAGLTWWGVNAMSDAYGCGDEYYNPYYSETTINYSEPIVTTPAQEGATETAPAQENLDKFDQARVAFYEGKYDDALKLVDEAAVKMPRDAVLHEFRSLILFALKRYGESAAAIHAVLAVGPGWDWKTLSSLYPDVDTYTSQMRALESYCNENPKSAEGRFLLGYHYLTTGASEAALNQFKRANELQPKDSVSADLVRQLTPRDPAAKPAATTATAAKPVPPDNVVGKWSAAGKDSAKFAMNLDKEGTFTWNFSKGSRNQEVKGVYTVEGNVLAMEPNSGGTMLAELSLKAPDGLHFKMIGSDKSDPGLDFKKGQ
jgi:tetratricopeptide (TPR) repeat protein